MMLTQPSLHHFHKMFYIKYAVDHGLISVSLLNSQYLSNALSIDNNFQTKNNENPDERSIYCSHGHGEYSLVKLAQGGLYSDFNNDF